MRDALIRAFALLRDALIRAFAFTATGVVCLLAFVALTYDRQAITPPGRINSELSIYFGFTAMYFVISFFGSFSGFLLPAKGRVSVLVAAAFGILYLALAYLLLVAGLLGYLGSVIEGGIIATAAALAWGANRLAGTSAP